MNGVHGIQPYLNTFAASPLVIYLKEQGSN